MNYMPVCIINPNSGDKFILYNKRYGPTGPLYKVCNFLEFTLHNFGAVIYFIPQFFHNFDMLIFPWFYPWILLAPFYKICLSSIDIFHTISLHYSLALAVSRIISNTSVKKVQQPIIKVGIDNSFFPHEDWKNIDL